MKQEISLEESDKGFETKYQGPDRWHRIKLSMEIT